jgi:hypothetical protein
VINREIEKIFQRTKTHPAEFVPFKQHARSIADEYFTTRQKIGNTVYESTKDSSDPHSKEKKYLPPMLVSQPHTKPIGEYKTEFRMYDGRISKIVAWREDGETIRVSDIPLIRQIQARMTTIYPFNPIETTIRAHANQIKEKKSPAFRSLDEIIDSGRRRLLPGQLHRPYRFLIQVERPDCVEGIYIRAYEEWIK